MSTPTLDNRMNPADLCRANGWDVGTRLAGDEGNGETVIEITAIGRKVILAFVVTHKGEEVYWGGYESSWILECRDWRVVGDEGGKWVRVETLDDLPAGTEFKVVKGGYLIKETDR